MILNPKTIEAIMGADKDEIEGVLDSFAISKGGWDEFARALEGETRKTMLKFRQNLNREGIFLQLERGKPVYYTVLRPLRDNDKDFDLCTLCEKECPRKDDRGVFKLKEKGVEVDKCWQKQTNNA